MTDQSTTPAPEPEWLKLSQVAALHDCHYVTVFRAVTRGALRAKLFGLSSWFVTREDAEAWSPGPKQGGRPRKPVPPEAEAAAE